MIFKDKNILKDTAHSRILNRFSQHLVHTQFKALHYISPPIENLNFRKETFLSLENNVIHLSISLERKPLSTVP